MQIKKAPINDRFRVWKASWKFCIPTTYNFALPVKLAIFLKISLLFNFFNLRFCPYTGKYGPVETRILAFKFKFGKSNKNAKFLKTIDILIKLYSFL